MSNIAQAYGEALNYAYSQGKFGDATQAFLRATFPELMNLRDLQAAGEVDVFGNRKDAPGYSLADSQNNPNPIIGNVSSFIDSATPLTISLLATSLVWTYRDIWVNYLWEAEDKLEVI